MQKIDRNEGSRQENEITAKKMYAQTLYNSLTKNILLLRQKVIKKLEVEI